MSLKINRSNISEHLLEYQLGLIGKTVKDAIEIGDWRNQWGYTPQVAEVFRRYAIPLIKKVFKCRKEKAVATFDWFLLNFGLKIYK